MQLVLARHGNTFGPDDKVVWVGARSDLPLVDKGRAQAEAVAAALKSAGLAPLRIYAGPLRRTRETAAIVAASFALGEEATVISEDLREIDYGSWEGRSNDEIRAESGDEAIDGWQKRSLWPDGFGWKPGEGEVLAGWRRLLARIAADNAAGAIVLVVSSNGIFRLVAKALGLAPAEAKMATGALARIEIADGQTRVLGWNLPPERLAG